MFAAMARQSKVYGKGRSIMLTDEQDARLERLLEAVKSAGIDNRNQLFRLVAAKMTPDDVQTLLSR